MTAANGNYLYYPGCSQRATSHAYEKSAKLVGDRLGFTLEEVHDWNCCGATDYFSVNVLPAYSLVARNLSLAAEQGDTRELVAPCSACYLNLRKTDTNMGKYPKLNSQVNQALAAGHLHYTPGTLNIRHLLDVIVQDIGFDEIEAHVTQPLAGLRVAPYYGCLIVRPDTGYNTEYPTHLDELLRRLGATVVDFPMKTHCCGGHMTQISEEVALELIRRLLSSAAEYAADMIVTLCPMCQVNLDAYQGLVNQHFHTNYKLPVLFFTQLMGLAFGIPAKDLEIGSEIVPADAALAKIGQEESAKPRRAERRDKQALPMPSLDR
ncbi:MAG: CoB--CoM heterodisulfide reductase iron-sulfur subunit B family protein [Anaerolineaceae bacterium]|nr:CoB--CoM heterodisulfide reductase iron-sulfur subunit B family protein [Anaerolineaceae bacterium]